MNIKNYTSNISADVTIARIERLIVDAGATGIAKEYEQGRVKALVFQLPYDSQKLPMTIKLPANVDGCVDALWDDYKKHIKNKTRKTRDDFTEQGAMTAWKLQQDWVHVQVTLMRLNQQTGIQAFMAYIYDGQQTYYERLQAGKFKALLPASTP